MLGLGLVRPLEDDWRASIDVVARQRRWPTTEDVARLGATVAQLSEAYNDSTVARAAIAEAGPARLGFAFARDVPKGAGAVRELVATGTLRLDRALRVLDVGAGLGATTWGLVRALEASGARGTVHATWVDRDTSALDVGRALAAARVGKGGVGLRVEVRAGRVEDLTPGRFDVILLGNVLSELHVEADPEARVELHAHLLGSLVERFLETNGSLVVVEPALRDRTRHLHRVRDRVVARGMSVFAPCLHAAPCPALAKLGDWCHEDLPVDLPPWLVPVARSAGLRHQGLTFSYLVLRRDGATLARHVGPREGGSRVRVVSDLLRTKGKVEAYVCGEVGAARGPGRACLRRLDRDRSPGNATFDHLKRGDVVVVSPPPDADALRIARAASVFIVSPNDDFVDR